MKILINTSFLLNKESGQRLKQFLVDELIANYPSHEFIILSDQRPHPRPAIINQIDVFNKMPARHPLLWKWWHDFKLPAIIKKYQPDVFVSLNGFCSSALSVPQCVALYDLSFLYDGQALKKHQAFFYKRYLPAFFAKAKRVITSSQFLKNEIVRLYGSSDEKIDIVPVCLREETISLQAEEQLRIREQYTSGKHYFLCSGKDQQLKDLVTVLKAFSTFKKRLKTNWMLVFASSDKELERKISNYKYREDVVLAANVSPKEIQELAGAAYACIGPFRWNGLDHSIFTAMQTGSAIIANDHPVLKELGRDGLLYANLADEKDIADKMMLLYKDESLRARLAEKAGMIVAGNTAPICAERLWESITKAVAPAQQPLA